MKPKKCRHCREPFTPARPMQKACSPACAIALTKKQAEAAALKKKREDLQKDRAKRHQLKTIPQLIAEAQIAFNRFIRLRDAGRGCISCGGPLQLGGVGGGFDCGHYRSRGAASHLRFHEDNAHGQCKRCNRRLAGNAGAYRMGLLERIGADRLHALEADNFPVKWTRELLEQIKRDFAAKAKALENPRPSMDSGAQLGACAI